MKKLILSILGISITLLFSCEDIIYEDDISDETVHLVAPYDGAVFNSTGITFTWDPIENGSQYRIQIARPNFDQPLEIMSDNVIDSTSFTTQLNVGTYQWRVQGVNSSYTTRYSTRSFTIQSNEDFQNNSVTLLSPANNALTNVAQQQLLWQAVIGATVYQLQLIRLSDSSVIIDEETVATSYPYTFSDGNYQWKVRAGNGEQHTLYASRNISIDITAPGTPVLNAPVNLSNSSDNDVIFQWSRTPIAGSQEKDSIYIYNNNLLTDLEYKDEHNSPFSKTLDNGTYYWYVKSFDAAGNAGQQSSVFSFTLN